MKKKLIKSMLSLFAVALFVISSPTEASAYREFYYKQFDCTGWGTCIDTVVVTAPTRTPKK
jgi:hypothetical protein